MGIVYVGVGLCGGLGAFFVRGITSHFGFRPALLAVGALMFVVWPLAVLILKDRPSEIGQFPDGESQPPPDLVLRPEPISRLLRNWPFWLLLLGSFCSIGSIGSINMHMKFVFRDQGFTDQKLLNAAWTDASVLILWSSIAGRLGIGYLADRFSKKWVMTWTYFIVAASIPLLYSVSPERHTSLYVFAIVFGFAMGADYMLIPLIAADQFGVNTLSRAMAIILPVNAIGGSWCPELMSVLRQQYNSYAIPLTVVFGIAVVGAVAIAIMPKTSMTFGTGAERATSGASRNL
jgi:MFS family permease